MKTSIASVLAVLFASQAAYAQDPEPSPNPVEEQEVDASAESGPAEGSGMTVDAAPATANPGADDGEAEKWDVTAPRGATIRQVPIRTDEGTWMDVDVSPDGRMLAFSLLGDVYTMPITGGAPTRIAEGLAWEVQPRFSPDGQRIAFTSDRGGGDNIWIMNADGSDKRQLTKEDFRLLNQASWSPDGNYIVAKKHFTTQRSLGTGEIWLYHVSGGGGVKLVARASDTLQKELGEPVYSPDGGAVYYSRNVTSGPIFEYAQDSTQGTFAIERYDLATGEVTTAVSGFGGAVRPQPSPDGKSLAFIRRDKDQTELWIKDLASGEQRMIYGDLDMDMQETWAVHGFYPLIDWTPDGNALVLWAGGKLRLVAADGSGDSVIPFSVNDTRGVADAPHPVIPVAPDSFTAKIPRFASVSPDGRTVVFESLGKLYAKPVAGGTARRLTSASDAALELWPSWSRDGRRITYIRWTDDGLGQVMSANANGSGARAVTRMPGHYAQPRFSPDGSTIVFEKRSGGYLTAPEYSENEGIYRVSASGGAAQLVARDTSNPQFGASSDRVFMLGRKDGKLQLLSADLDGEARQVHAEGELATEYHVSPRGDFVAFRENYEVFATPLMPGGQAVTVGEKASSLPVVRASKGGADYIGWTQDGDMLTWTMGPVLYRASVASMFANAPKDKDAPKFVPPTSGTSLERTIAADKPRGTVAITGAKILTMAGEGAGEIANGTIVITGNRIAAIGPASSVTVPQGATVIDAGGKTIMPGLVDAHAHGPQGVGDLVPQQNWSLVQNLAMGTTTLHDPSSSASMIFSASERQQAGQLLAPRIFSTAEIVYGAKAPSVYARIDSYDDALAHIQRIKAQGGISIKNYNQPRRDQRQQVVAAARAENMLVVAEGGSLFGMDMNLIADGNSTIEHNVPGEVFYEDVLQFWQGSQSNYTPTLVVTYGGLAGDPYWRQATDVFDNPLMVHTPPRQLIAQTARRVTAPDWAFVDDEAAREAKKLAERGVKVSIGAHGQQAGVAAHWELWSFARGGMTAVEALRAGTIESARSLGMDRDIGSLEVGKLADLLVLSADPSENIRNSDKIDRVMLGGRLYDARTMNEVETGSARRLPYWWE
ncbi:amidohydrolase family protein [Qipengyuania profunda]|jgi:imidazolonepropionase-like amidohydrolase/Tol biopolymer transport system component|uniref:amidohydrolase family protein n=1 Tax=Qipengyuania profunda TaxID=3113984 RepID=UPI002A18B63E|nr:amidohydrolase family protein [Qipengyuania sp. HL-TH1]WPL56722.1 amidohydrolase family protein [Qipengyuania sp. HL-TH5]